MQIENARGQLDLRLIRRLRQQAAIAEVSRRAVINGPLSKVLHLAVQRVIDLLPVDHCIGLERMPDGGVRVAASDLPDNTLRIETHPIPEGTLRRALDSGESQQSIGELSMQERLLLAGRPEGSTGFLLALPVMTARGPWGLLCVTAAKRISFGDEDLQFLQMMVEAIGASTELAVERRGQNRFRTLLDKTSDLVAITDLKGVAEYLNPAGRTMLGLPDADQDGEAPNLMDYLTADYQTHFREVIIPALRKQDNWSGEISLRAPSGRELHLSQVVVAHRDERGRVERLSTVARDCTQETLRARNLRMREAQLQRAQALSRVMTNRMSLDGYWLRVAPQFCRMLGYSEREMVGRHYSDVTWPEELDNHRRALIILRRGRLRSIDTEKRYVHRDGQVIWVELNVTVVNNPDGNPGYLLCQVMDITERKQIQQALDYRSSYLELIADLSGRFICAPAHELEMEMDRSLGLIGRHAGVDRAYLMEVDEESGEFYCTHAWVGIDNESASDETLSMPLDSAGWVLKRCHLGDFTRIAELDDLPEAATADRTRLQAQSIQSMLVCPLRIGERLVAAVGLGMVREPRDWTRDMERMLGLTGQMLLNVLQRRRMDQALADSEQRYRAMVENAADAVIAERKKAEKHLHDERYFTDSAINSLPGIFYVCDQRGQLRRWNRRLEAVTGFTSESLCSMRLQDLFTPSDRPKIWRRLERLLNQDGGSVEASLIAHDGSVVPYLLTGIRSESQGKRYLVGMGMDVSERHTSERERTAYLRRTRLQHQTIGRVATSDAVVEGDLDAVYGEVALRLADVLQASRAGVWLFNEKRTQLRCVELYSTEQSVHESGQVLNIARYPSYLSALEEGVGVDAVDVEHDPRTRELFSDYLGPLDIRSLLDTPIRISGQAMGVVTVEQVGMRRQWTVDEISFVGAMADQVAQSLINRDRRQSAQALQDSERRYRVLYDHNPSMFFTVDREGLIRSVNRFAAETLGRSVEELVKVPFDKLHAEEDQALVQAWVSDCIGAHGELRRWDTRLARAEDEPIWIRVTARSIRDVDGARVMLAVCEDITEARKLSEELSYQASHDSLTGLYNRREFEQRLERALQGSKLSGDDHALLYLDLDQFKVINDTCGHIAGDELLRQLSDVLRSRVSKRDTLARLGGDEFGVLLEHCTPDNAQRVAEAARSAIAEFRFSWSGQTFGLGVSIGLVPITSTSTSINDILSLADTACYAAKDQGRNRIHTYREDDFELARRHGEMQWVNRIRHALDEDRFQLYQQRIVPLADTDSSEMHYELLLRMRDEAGELVLPNAFLPAAERYNLASRLDRWVMLEALNWLAARPEHLRVLGTCSINLSGHSLGDEDFLDFVLMEIRNAKVPAEKLCFEITETAAIRNLSTATRFIRRLKDEGCRFALDDFGSGLSSFAYLKNLPVDYLKIDGVFIQDILDDPIDLAVVKSINDIGHVMGKQTIAEFVESVEIMERLKQIGVDFVQGYAIAAPASLASLISPKD
ncbi:MAG: PAS domain S-box protein [Aquisalimonadaceae bacterium]